MQFPARSRSAFLTAVVALFWPLTGLAVDLGDFQIPADRIALFTPGVDGDIPDTSDWTVIDVTKAPYSALPNDGSSDGRAIERAVEEAPDNSIIYLPAGVYVTNNSVIEIARSNIVLRGDGAGRTIINGTLGGNTPCGNGQMIALCGGLDGSDLPWTGGFTEGTATVTLASTSGLSPGDWLVLVQENDSYIENSQNRDYMGHIAKITAISGTRVTLDRPLRHDFNPGLEPRARKMRPVENVGIEDMTIQYTSAANADYSIAILEHAVNSWIKGAHFHQGGNRHLRVKKVARLTFRGNEFDTLAKDTDYNYYSIALGERTQDVLVENNVFHNNFIDVEIDGGAHGNVIAYNYRTGSVCNRFIFFHGRYAHHNLAEGNAGNCHIEMDNYWGRQGPYNVIFRNRLTNTVNKGIRTHRDTGSWIVAENTSYLANITLGFWGEPGCKNYPPNCHPFTRGHKGLWGEKNIAHGGPEYLKDSTDGGDVTYIDMVAGSSAPEDWAGFRFPRSFYLPGDGQKAPTWWRLYDEDKPWPGIGADVDDMGGSLTKLPAQERFEGGTAVEPPSEPPGDSEVPPAAPFLLD